MTDKDHQVSTIVASRGRLRDGLGMLRVVMSIEMVFGVLFEGRHAALPWDIDL